MAKEQPAHQKSIPFLIYTFGFGIPLFIVIVYAGYKLWPFWLTILVGGLVQTAFRISKQSWRNKLAGTIVHPQRQESSDSAEDVALRDKVEANLNSPLGYLMVYAAMVGVTAFWYGLGWVFT